MEFIDSDDSPASEVARYDLLKITLLLSLMAHAAFLLTPDSVSEPIELLYESPQALSVAVTIAAEKFEEPRAEPASAIQEKTELLTTDQVARLKPDGEPARKNEALTITANTPKAQFFVSRHAVKTPMYEPAFHCNPQERGSQIRRCAQARNDVAIVTNAEKYQGAFEDTFAHLNASSKFRRDFRRLDSLMRDQKQLESLAKNTEIDSEFIAMRSLEITAKIASIEKNYETGDLLKLIGLTVQATKNAVSAVKNSD